MIVDRATTRKLNSATSGECLRLGDRVEFRVVLDAKETRLKGVQQYKAVDVRLERAPMTDSEESLDEPAAAPTPAQHDTSIRLRLLPVTDDALGFCSDVVAKAERRGLRCEVDPAGKNCLNKQIRYAEKLRVPVICVVGEQEASSGKLSVRARGRGDLGKIDVDVLLDMLGGVEHVDQLDSGAFERPVAPEASARPLPTLLQLDADFCLELARELLRSEL